MQVKLKIRECLKDLRVLQKLTLEQLAVEVGISKSTLENLNRITRGY